MLWRLGHTNISLYMDFFFLKITDHKATCLSALKYQTCGHVCTQYSKYKNIRFIIWSDIGKVTFWVFNYIDDSHVILKVWACKIMCALVWEVWGWVTLWGVSWACDRLGEVKSSDNGRGQERLGDFEWRSVSLDELELD